MREDELEILQGRRYASLVADVDGEVDSWSNCATSVLDHVGTSPVPLQYSTVYQPDTRLRPTQSSPV